MPKFIKERKKESKSKRIPDDKLILKSVKISAILAGVFLVLSLFFNGTEWFFEGIIIRYVKKEIYWEILDHTIKTSVIVLEFFFMMISLGNYKELTGKPVKLKEILFLLGLSLIQTIRSLIVFILTLIGVFAILFYLYLIQES
ncbi:MAG: hypothetical protein ACFFDO_02165 [Candidatus Thorarchaeota archaeon]